MDSLQPVCISIQKDGGQTAAKGRWHNAEIEETKNGISRSSTMLVIFFFCALHSKEVVLFNLTNFNFYMSQMH